MANSVEGHFRLMRTWIWLCMLAVALLAAPCTDASAAVMTPPWAHMHSVEGWNHYYDAGESPQDWWTYTSSSKLAWGEPWLDQVGYNCYADTNLSGWATIDHWKSDAIFIFAGHGGAGYFGTGPTVDYATYALNDPGPDGPRDYVFAKRHGQSYAAPHEVFYVEDFQGMDIQDCVVGLFISCKSAADPLLTDPGTGDPLPNYGNLLDQARAEGIDVAIGWPCDVYFESNAIFGMGFARGARYYGTRPIDYPQGYNSGVDVDLMDYAYDYMCNNTPNMSVTEKLAYRFWETQGWSSQTLNPSHYGNP